MGLSLTMSRTGSMAPVLAGRVGMVVFWAVVFTFGPLVCPASAQSAAPEWTRFTRAAVQVATTVPSDTRTAAFLGSRRSGNGVVIDGAGLVLTIGYLILEADTVTVTDSAGRQIPAEVVAYDFDTGFGLVRALAPLDAEALRLGESGALPVGAPLVAMGHEAAGGLVPVKLVDKREFAGYWEYLLDEALFTAPRHPGFGGAALLDAEGKLVGIGSLQVRNANGGEQPGNMFVPIDLLKPVLADMIAFGKAEGPRRPWLGLTGFEMGPGVFVHRVTSGGPAFEAGIRPGDVVVGVQGNRIRGLADFLRQLWAVGSAGTDVTLHVFRGRDRRSVIVTTADRYDFLNLEHTY